MTTRELADIDKRVLWHPFTQQQGWCEEAAADHRARAAGCTLYDTDGNAYLDGVSSLWCNVHGHGHPAIDRAVRAQLEQGRPHDDARPLAPGRDRARAAARRHRAARA